MIDDSPPRTDTQPPWSRTAPAGRWRREPDTPLRRFLGGSPASTLVKLVFLSLIVGAILMWLDIRPADIFRMLSNLATRLYDLGFGALREFATYIGAGAALVIPVWLLTRILSYRAPPPPR
jgi:hypothetical protein